MPSGDYGVYCVNCKEFIQINSYTDYRPDFSPTEGGQKLLCDACGDVTVYTADRIVYRDNLS